MPFKRRYEDTTMQIYSESDVNVEKLAGKRIAVLGYGSQGRAHALNLKDSGFEVVVGLRPDGASWAKAQADGLEVQRPEDAVAEAALVAFLVPDTAQPGLHEQVGAGIPQSATLLFAHGFNIHYDQIRPREDLDVVLIAPKGPGDLVRREYEQGQGVPCLVAVAQNPSGDAKATALAYAHGIGGSKGGGLETTFAEET
ncbi:uncharacterized protein METZ01_LOCUS281756, partial [marine metagenome]